MSRPAPAARSTRRCGVRAVPKNVGEKLALLPHGPPHRYWRGRARPLGLGLVGAVSRLRCGRRGLSPHRRRRDVGEKLALLPHGPPHRFCVGARLRLSGGLGLVGVVSRLRCGRRGLSPHRRRNVLPYADGIRPDRGRRGRACSARRSSHPAGLGSLTRLPGRGARIHPGTLVTTRAVSPDGVRGPAGPWCRRRSPSGDTTRPRPACGRTQLGAEHARPLRVREPSYHQGGLTALRAWLRCLNRAPYTGSGSPSAERTSP